jgi:hypothetical protein
VDDTRRTFLRRQFSKLLAASVLLNALILVGMLTSSPTVSPASTWMTAVDAAYYRVRPVAGRQSLEDLHAGAGKLTKEQCQACHGTMLGSRFTIHRIHLNSELLPGLACAECHKSVSLEKRTNTHVVRLVDVAFCKKCHSAFPGLDPKSPMKPSDFQADCTTCHGGKHTYRHDQPYLSHVIAPRECTGCHGGRILPWTPAHELDNWVAQHGRIALKVGTQTCMKCHELGMQFCNDCHSKQPPSHQPRDLWLANHPAAAKRDTRACFTCHVTAFCKRCHINHTANWRDTHMNFVVKNGAEACMGCHSGTFCESCHISGKPSPATIPPAVPATAALDTTAPPSAAGTGTSTTP